MWLISLLALLRELKVRVTPIYFEGEVINNLACVKVLDLSLLLIGFILMNWSLGLNSAEAELSVKSLKPALSLVLIDGVFEGDMWKL